MKLRGRAWKFGSNVDTDAIIPARYLNVADPDVLAEHCMEDENPEFARGVKSGDMIVAGTNFGCGSSREHAPIAIKARGISCIIARSFARIFYRNAFNMGLPIVESGEAVDGIEDGHELEVDLTSGEITNVTTGLVFKSNPIPPFMRQIIDDGGLMQHIARRRR
ncbi:MAG: 3-isopropylmalate dehydratase small subunit [Deltaproteobacteria bacterium]|nr:3-isopropylmalate dehydratase small subunit [Deltaproteobacteria bacterium]MBW2123846.1 3-isopropylmalate dehydratase small subunit [Deltaproteobacteria bacterium]